MLFEKWDDTRRELALALEDLADGEFLILGEPVPTSAPRRGLLGRRPLPVPTRYVQALRIEDVFSAECVGAATLGGTWEMDPLTISRLRLLGWLTPMESKVAYGNVTPNFEQYVERADLPALTAVLVASLDLLGAVPHDLELQSSGGWAQQARG
jgi:hypothetical protein